MESLTALLPVLEACYQVYKRKAGVMEKVCDGNVNERGVHACVRRKSVLQRTASIPQRPFNLLNFHTPTTKQLCRLLKHALRTGKSRFAPLLDSLLAFIAG